MALRLDTMRKRADFLAANRGHRVAMPGFVVLARPNGDRGLRLGVTVTKKIGNAVIRNRMKRRFRELARSVLPEAGRDNHDYVMIGRADGIERAFAQMRAELVTAVERLNAGKGDRGRRPNRRTRSFPSPPKTADAAR